MNSSRQAGERARPSPKVVFGVMVKNQAEYAREALESLRAQSYRDFAMVIVDDCSTDGTSGIAAELAREDHRVSYHRNDRRLGGALNWRRAFELARELHPGAEYFAWGTDHDVWHPEWLSTLLPELESEPDVVLAYPRTQRISETGEVIHESEPFDTLGVEGVHRRLSRTYRGMLAGNMVYGLYRADALARAGVTRLVLMPDVLLLAELSLYGPFKQVPEVLWYRRFAGPASLRRQRASFFQERRPLHSYLPWWLTHTGALAWSLAGRGSGAPTLSRGRGILVAAQYLYLSSSRDVRRKLARARKRLLRSRTLHRLSRLAKPLLGLERRP
jgi:glycosyltransferase involved in cell wall biosynthesis